MTALLLTAALIGLAYVAGRVHEGCRKGGTLDLQVEVATRARGLTEEIREAHRRAGLS